MRWGDGPPVLLLQLLWAYSILLDPQQEKGLELFLSSLNVAVQKRFDKNSVLLSGENFLLLMFLEKLLTFIQEESFIVMGAVGTASKCSPPQNVTSGQM